MHLFTAFCFGLFAQHCSATSIMCRRKRGHDICFHVIKDIKALENGFIVLKPCYSINKYAYPQCDINTLSIKIWSKSPNH